MRDHRVRERMVAASGERAARALRLFVLAIVAFEIHVQCSDAKAQPAGAAPKIGILRSVDRHPAEDAFWKEMRRLGYVDGRNITVVERSADGDFARLPALAKELAALRVDVIVSQVTQASLAAKKATASIPVVMVAVSDPVGSGLVQSLAHPGGNVTGTSAGVAGVVGKQLELLHQLNPGVSRVAVLWNPANPVFQQQQLKELEAAARGLNMQADLFEARTPDQLDGAFARIAGARHAILLTLADPMYTIQAKRIADLALAHKLIAVSGTRAYADAGFVAAYGPDFSDAYRRAASYVDRILRGARPSDLPVEQSTKFELVVNLKTARALGITIPQSIMVRTDDRIE